MDISPRTTRRCFFQELRCVRECRAAGFQDGEGVCRVFPVTRFHGEGPMAFVLPPDARLFGRRLRFRLALEGQPFARALMRQSAVQPTEPFG